MIVTVIKPETPNLDSNLFVSVYFLDSLIIYIPLLIRTSEQLSCEADPSFFFAHKILEYTTCPRIFYLECKILNQSTTCALPFLQTP